MLAAIYCNVQVTNKTTTTTNYTYLTNDSHVKARICSFQINEQILTSVSVLFTVLSRPNDVSTST